MKKIKIGVAGAGSMGVNHIRIVSELNNIFQFMGIFDPNPATEAVAKKYDVKFYPSYEAMLDEIDAVIIASPSSFHYEMAVQAANKNVHALVEKPMAETVPDVTDMQRRFKEKQLILAVSCVERFSPVIQVISDIIKDEEIFAVEIHRCSPYDPRIFDVDVVSDLMIHDIDIVCNAIFNAEPISVEAYGMNTFSAGYVDYAHAVLTFPNNIRAFITSSRSTQDKIRSLCIHTRNAYIEADMLNKAITIKRGIQYVENAPNVSYKQFQLTEQIVVPNKEPLKEDIMNFGKAIIGEDVFLVEGEQVLRDMRTLDAIHLKLYTNL